MWCFLVVLGFERPKGHPVGFQCQGISLLRFRRFYVEVQSQKCRYEKPQVTSPDFQGELLGQEEYTASFTADGGRLGKWMSIILSRLGVGISIVDSRSVFCLPQSFVNTWTAPLLKIQRVWSVKISGSSRRCSKEEILSCFCLTVRTQPQKSQHDTQRCHFARLDVPQHPTPVSCGDTCLGKRQQWAMFWIYNGRIT